MSSKQAHRPEIGEDLAFQRCSWRAQRVGWVLLGALIIAGLSGVMGSGPLSAVDARGGKGLEVEYERFVRHGARTEIRVKVTQPQSLYAHVAVSREYLGTLDLRGVVPAPSRVEAAGDDVVYTFEIARNEPLYVRFVIQPDRMGHHVGRITIANGSSVSLRQFTYP